MTTQQSSADHTRGQGSQNVEGFGNIPFNEYNPAALKLDFSNSKLSGEQLKGLTRNIEIMRDSIIFFTACGAGRGVAGHTGGPYDTAPEATILEAFFTNKDIKDKFVPIHFDEAGHRVATQVSCESVQSCFVR